MWCHEEPVHWRNLDMAGRNGQAAATWRLKLYRQALFGGGLNGTAYQWWAMVAG